MPVEAKVAPVADAEGAASSAEVAEDQPSLNPQSNPNFVPRSLRRYTVRKSQGAGDGMKFGFYLPTHGPTAHPSALKQIARRGDELGYSYMVAGDHIIAPKQVYLAAKSTRLATGHTNKKSLYIKTNKSL